MMSNYTILLTSERKRQLEEAYREYIKELARIDREELLLTKPIRYRMTQDREVAWKTFLKKRREILR